jgi:protocatechuate 3,4-dioxygenase beta subunit
MRRSGLLLAPAASLLLVGSVASTAHATTPPPGPVTHAGAVSSSSTSVLVSWTNPSSHSFASTVVRYAIGTAAPATPTAGLRGGVVTKPHHTLTVAKLTAGTHYTFALFASDGHGHYARRASAGAITAPAPVTGLAAFDHGTYVSVNWADPRTSTFAGVTVRYAVGSTAPAAPTRGTAVALSTAKATGAHLPALAKDTKYSVAVWAFDSGHRYSTVARTVFTTQAGAPPTRTISGTVTDEAEAPLAGVLVAVGGFDGARQDTATTDGNGHYTLTVVPGDVVVDFDGVEATGGNSDATGYVGDEEYVTIPASADKVLDVTLSPGAAVTGRVTDAAGAPLSGMTVYPAPVQPYVDVDNTFAVFFLDFGAAGPATSAADGTYKLSGLPTVALRVCFDPSGQVTGGGNDSLGYTSGCRQRAMVLAPHATRAVDDFAVQAVDGGVVAGRVTSSTGIPVEGAIVGVQEATDDGSGDGGSVYTAADGSYRVADLPAGNYTVCVYTSALTFAPGDAGDATTCVASAVAVQVGHSATADVQLHPGGALTGKITSSTGVALAGVQVYVDQIGSDGFSASFAVTDSQGHYTVAGLAPGRYTVCFDASSVSGPASPTGFLPDCFAQGAAVGVKVGWKRLGIDTALRRGGAVAGIVTDDLGRPIPYAEVVAESLGDPDANPGGFGQADADGRYRITGLSTDSYSICFQTLDFGTQGGRACYGESNIHPDGTAVNVTVGATRTGINGKINTGGAIEITVHDADGQPLAGVDVTAVGACDDSQNFCRTLPLLSPTTTVTVAASDTTATDGVVTLSHLTPGKYAVCLFAYYAATQVGDSATGYSDSCSGTTFNVTVTAHQTTQLARTLTAAGTVTGTITDADGHPVAGALVKVSHAATSDYQDGLASYDVPPPLSGPEADAVTGADGAYTVHGVTPGEQTVCVDASAVTSGGVHGYFDQCVGGQPGAVSDGTPITVTAGQVTSGVNLQLASGGAVTGTVRSLAHQPIAHVDVVLFDATGKYVTDTLTDAAGGYALGRLPAGVDKVCFLDSFGASCYKNVTWSGSQPPLARATPVQVGAGVTTPLIDGVLAR